MARKPRVVLAGCGSIANAWLGSQPVRKKVEVVGLVDLRRKAAVASAERHGLSKAEAGTNLTTMLRKTEPDAVFDCTVPEAHCDVTLTALRHGCHVLGEKPMADSMPNARKMVRAAEKAGRLYAVTQTRRYNPAIIALRRFIASGKIGRVTTLQANFFIGAHFGGFREAMEHVLLLDMAIHTFDAARYLTGADAEHVYCRDWNPAGSWYRHGASAVAVFEMTEHIVFTYHGSWCSEGCNTGWDSAWRVIGEKGTVLWDGADGFRAEIVKGQQGFMRPQREIRVRGPGGKEWHTGHGGAIREFLGALAGGPPPQTVCTDNIKSLAMVHAAIASAKSGRRVQVRI